MFLFCIYIQVGKHILWSLLAVISPDNIVECHLLPNTTVANYLFYICILILRFPGVFVLCWLVHQLYQLLKRVLVVIFVFNCC